MNRDQIKGAAEKTKGAIEDTAGKITGDAKLQAEGKLEKSQGCGPQRCRRCQRSREEHEDGSKR